MIDATRGIIRRLRRAASRRRFYGVYRERGYYVLVNLLTNRKWFYARPNDVWCLLDKPLRPLEE